MSYGEIKAHFEEHGVSTRYAWALHQTHGSQALRELQRDPYLLTLELRAPFDIADNYARRIGVRDARRRADACIVGLLEAQASAGGHVCVRAEGVETIAHAFGVTLSTSLAAEGAPVVGDGEYVYLRRLHDAETNVANDITRLLRTATPTDVPLIKQGSFTLTPEQESAARDVGVKGVSVITGAPGVGKTAILQAIVQSWVAAGKHVLLAAPTGRAAKRMTDSVGVRAQTIHRLLCAEPNGGGNNWFFAINRQMPLSVDLLVVDESSMLDTELAHALFQSVPDGAHVLLVGDVDQLPSVGPGRVLEDIIKSGVVPTARLTRIFRQGDRSDIVTAAHAILAGKTPMSSKRKLGDFYLWNAATPQAARDQAVEMVTTRIPATYNIPPMEIQVLTPMHEGVAGRLILNRILQAKLNSAGAILERDGALPLRVGDRVMMTRNDYMKDAFNGDTGVILDGTANGLVVKFEDGHEAVYDGRDRLQLDLAYAMTCHKMQGGQVTAAVVVLTSEADRMLKRNLFYTAVTRARRLCVVTGHQRAFAKAAATADQAIRLTGLLGRLKTLAPTV